MVMGISKVLSLPNARLGLHARKATGLIPWRWSPVPLLEVELEQLDMLKRKRLIEEEFMSTASTCVERSKTYPCAFCVREFI